MGNVSGSTFYMFLGVLVIYLIGVSIYTLVQKIKKKRKSIQSAFIAAYLKTMVRIIEGRNIRDSQTMGYETYYYALRLSGGDVLRVAQDAETVWSIYDSTIFDFNG